MYGKERTYKKVEIIGVSGKSRLISGRCGSENKRYILKKY